MWLHILKKDLKLHWPFIAAVLALKLASAWMIVRMGIFAQPLMLLLPQSLVDLALSIVAGLSIILVVHSDPVVSDNDDWLIRPIRRSDLALAKIAFAALVTFVPGFVFDLGVGLIHGLDVAPAIVAAVYTGLCVFVFVGLFALGVGTITASWRQAAGIVVAIFIAWAVGLMAVDARMVDLGSMPARLILQIIFVAAAAIILTLQYRGRKTAASRTVFVVAALCAFGLVFMPAMVAYRIQHLGDVSRGAGSVPIRLSFDDKSAPEVIGNASQPTTPVIYVPLKVAVDPDHIVTISNIVLNIADNDGKSIFRSTIAPTSGYPPRPVSNVLGNTFDAASNERVSNFQAIDLPADVFAKFKDTLSRVTLSYNLNAYVPAASVRAMLAFGVPQKIAGFGVCATRTSPLNDRIAELYCFPATDSANCVAAVVDPSSAVSALPHSRCATTSVQWGLNTRALTGPGQFVVAFVANSGAGIRPLTLTKYRVASRFTQTVVLPELRLKDLMASPRA